MILWFFILQYKIIELSHGGGSNYYLRHTYSDSVTSIFISDDHIRENGCRRLHLFRSVRRFVRFEGSRFNNIFKLCLRSSKCHLKWKRTLFLFNPL